MRNLLSENLHRLKKDKLFWLCLVGTFLFEIMLIMTSNYEFVGLGTSWCGPFFVHFFFDMIPMLGFVMSTFMGLYIGAEYSNGTLRNKIMIGHKRRNIYLSNYICCLIVNLLILFVWILGGILGVTIIGYWEMLVSQLISYFAVLIVATVALTGIFTMLCMNTSNRAVSVVAAIFLFLGLLIVGRYLYNSLCEPQMLSNSMILADGVVRSEPFPNPSYVSDTMRKIYENLLYVLPTGQEILVANAELDYSVVAIIISAVVAVLTNIVGCCIFCKKDLK